MIFGFGIDTIEVVRIKQAIEEYGLQFTDRIYAEHEMTYCSERMRKYEHFAARFAAKEAFSKALGTGARRGFRWKEVSVRNTISGKPQIELHGSMFERSKMLIGTQYQIQLSITHTDELAEAIVIIETGSAVGHF
ncbi:MAG TPA: holo-ACP synthase [Candidatus Kapabacteria bacterium]|nr:holo-ACP synthase [Candidatus Kapabacteria bacterium]